MCRGIATGGQERGSPPPRHATSASWFWREEGTGRLWDPFLAGTLDGDDEITSIIITRKGLRCVISPGIWKSTSTDGPAGARARPAASGDKQGRRVAGRTRRSLRRAAGQAAAAVAASQASAHAAVAPSQAQQASHTSRCSARLHPAPTESVGETVSRPWPCPLPSPGDLATVQLPPPRLSLLSLSTPPPPTRLPTLSSIQLAPGLVPSISPPTVSLTCACRTCIVAVVEHETSSHSACRSPVPGPLSATAPQNDEKNPKTTTTTAMSDAEAVPSLPAAPGARDTTRLVDEDKRKPSDPQSSKASPPPLQPPEKDASRNADAPGGDAGPSSPQADSEAETIIQSGRESLSPEKKRRPIKHERKRSDEGNDDVDAMEVDASLNDATNRKRKRMESDPRDEDERGFRPSSPRLRVASVPPSAVKTEKTEESPVSSKRRDPSRLRLAVPKNDKDHCAQKRSSSEGVAEREGETGSRVRAQHSSEAARDRERKEININNTSSTRRTSDDRSGSPTHRSHKRVVSGPQLGGGDSLKKKRAPPPLITGRQRHSSEDRQSVSSSASGSPLPTAHVRKLASSEGAATSPAKQMPSKKHRDQNGRTRLARACAARELEAAMARHAERPEDLNVADNAGNTPLQIAALEGCVPIVKFLLEAGCEVDTRNIDKDTPLIDAVENGHLEVVKLLLEAGANPRLVNAEGDEPYELVPSDAEDYEEIRRVLAEAKANPHPRRRTTAATTTTDEDNGNGNKGSSSRGASAASPRESPPVNGPRSPPPAAGTTSKRRTVRSEATRNDLLWTRATPENLREFAAKGDVQGVASILNVGQKADAESLIAAAKGGHDEVMQLLLGIGYADPDPEPVQSGTLRPGYNTPMLAAIGRGNLAVIRLLLAQPSFNPTRRPYRDRTYYELSQERQGENWEEEYNLLKEAYDNYIQARKMRKPDIKSPRRSRDKDKENKRPGQRESSSPVATQRKSVRSPTLNRHQETPAKEISSVREKKRDGVAYPREKSNQISSHEKLSSRDGSHSENSVAVSDADPARLEPSKSKASNLGRGHSDSAPNAHGEEVTKRRRLIAGRPPRDRDERRPSLLSSDSPSGREEASRSRVDRSSDVATAKNGSPSLKRSRSSVSPERSRSRGPENGYDSHETQKKKRRVLPEDGVHKVNGTLKKSPDSSIEQHKSQSRQRDNSVPDSERARSEKSETSLVKNSVSASKALDSSSFVKQEHKKNELQELNDIPMEVDIRADAEAEAKKAEAEAETRRLKEEAKKAEEERIAEEKRIAAEAERARIAKEEEAKEAAEKAARQAREKAEEEDRRRREAEQRRIKQAEDERQKRLEQERLRQAKLRKEQEEQEQRRRDALPNRLRVAANLVGSNDPRAKSHAWLKKFMPVVTAMTKQIDPSCDPEVANERWVPNFLVAPLLATNDLQLSQCMYFHIVFSGWWLTLLQTPVGRSGMRRRLNASICGV